MPQYQDAFRPELGSRAAIAPGALHEVILLRDSGQLGSPDNPALHRAEELISLRLAVLSSALRLGVENALPGVVIDMEKEILGQPAVRWPQLADSDAAGCGQLAFRVAVRPSAKIGLTYAEQSGCPGTPGIARRDDQAEMIDGFRRQLPAATGHGVLAVDLDAGDPVIGGVTIVEAELPVQVDLNERPHVGLLGLAQLIVVPAARVLAVIQLIKGVAEYRRDLVTCRIEPVQIRFDHIKLRVGPVG